MNGLYASAVHRYQHGQLREAQGLLEQILKAQSRHAPALNLLAIISAQTGNLRDAEHYFKRVARLQPANPDPHNNLGNLYLASGRRSEAERAYQQALKLDPRYPEAAFNLARLYHSSGRPAAAETAYRRAIAARPSFQQAFTGLGLLLRDTERQTEAEATLRKALRLAPNSPDALSGLATVLQGTGRLADAEQLLRAAIRATPQSAEIRNNLGQLLLKQHRLDEAETEFREAIRLRPDMWEVHNNLGLTLKDSDRLEEADAAFRRALQLNPGAPDAHNNLALVLKQAGRLLEARDCLQHLLKIAPDYRYAPGLLADVKASLCDWSDHRASADALKSSVTRGKSCVEPFMFLKVSDDPATQRQCAERFVKDWHQVSPALDPVVPVHSHRKIRLAYLSGDFREHPVAQLMEDLFAGHDRTQFELVAVSFGPDAENPVRTRLMPYFDRFLHVSVESDQDVARRVREMEIDIAVDLTGFTSHARTGILAHRPAPIQVNYLGFPGTLGAPFIDYLLADRVVIPGDAVTHYTENIVYLPDTFLTTSHWEISDRTPTREELGLPSEGFVFSCFNNCNKIQPDQFDIWMQLLHRTEGSVLWLAPGIPLAEANLKQEAQARGVDPGRLIFAPKIPLAEHLARQRRADLFLDTFMHNAITTAAMSLWAGLPVLTFPGNSFAARGCASLLQAIGLPELVTDSMDEYEALALDLAAHPERLAAIREKLERNRTNYPLFDTDRFRRNIEAAYRRMWEIRQSGSPPQSFSVDG
jgi:predicted O-linked N-acetylglucosamine transferase (SPINDLY family)